MIRRHAAKPDAFGNGAAFGRLGLAVLEQMIHRSAARVGDADRDVSFLLTQEATMRPQSCRRCRSRR